MTRKTIELRFKPRVNFYDKMYTIGDELLPDFPDWLTDRLSSAMLNKEKKLAAYLEFNRVTIVSENYNSDNDDFDKLVNKVIASYLKNLPANEIMRVGVRVTKTVKLKFKYHEYVSIFQNKF